MVRSLVKPSEKPLGEDVTRGLGMIEVTRGMAMILDELIF